MSERLPMAPASRLAPIELVDVREREGACDFKVRVSRVMRPISRELARRAVEFRPTLAEHSCSDGDGVERATPPHLLEHVAIDILVELSGDGTARAGYTVWLDRRRGLARITLSSADHSLTRRAMCDALKLVSGLAASILRKESR